jgi:hypothetical protein
MICREAVHVTTRIAITSSLVLAAMLLLPTSMASAQVTGACLKDAKAQAQGCNLQEARSGECLKTHIKDLSDDCKAVLLKAVNVKACAADVKQFCADEGRVEACMKARIADVSDACKVAMANHAAGARLFPMTGPPWSVAARVLRRGRRWMLFIKRC